MKIIRFFIIAIFIILSIAVHTQSLSIGAGLSLPTYWGDLNSNRIVKDIQTNTNIGVNIGAILNVNDYWSINGGFVYGKMQGDDAQSHQAYQIDRNLNFRTNLFESNLGLMLHPFAWRL
ncbi:MAG TPA: hypothetical protein PKD85_03240, partial [Saprospiraceae bacterium]|nr:hypothetical protein [Saprospiraceae bacterium]